MLDIVSGKLTFPSGYVEPSPYDFLYYFVGIIVAIVLIIKIVQIIKKKRMMK